MLDKSIKPGAIPTEELVQFLTFRLDGLDYGIPIIQVQEIRGWTKVTSLPNSPRYIRGVLNLRGTIVPIIDLRLRFNLNEAAYDSFTVIVVINVGQRLAGVVVDAVSDVISLSTEQRQTPPEFEGHANRQFVKGLAQIDEKLLVLLDVERLVNPDTLAEAVEAAA
ncbi:MAG: chemotaxis protein CheW [Gammaproteobacteria bacterium]|nr:chemotaxis protein CheW [Gammaproteobacteria bacterium]